MSSPRQRIQRLKKDIETLDQQMSFTNLPKKPLNLPLNIINLKKDSQREEMQQKITTLRLTTSGKEQTFTTQLSEIQQNLKNLARKKQKELASSKHVRESYKHKIDELKITLMKYKDELQIASTSLIEKKKIKENSTVAKARVYDESLVPLEIDARDLSIIKQKLVKKEGELMEKIKMLENGIVMSKEDLECRKVSRFEHIAVREEIEANLEFFVKEYIDEINYANDENDFLKKGIKIVMTQNKYKEEVIKLENILENHYINIEKLEIRYEFALKEIESVINNANDIKSNSEINKLEFMINKICEEMGIDTLDNVILDLNVIERFDIDEEILKLQLLQIKASESQIRQEFELEEKIFSEMIIIKHYENKSSEEIEENFRIKKSQYRNRLAAICQWKEEVELLITESELKNKVLVKDRNIIQEFNLLSAKIANSEKKSQLESLVSAYVTKIANRDKIIQNYSSHIRDKNIEKSKIYENLVKARQETYRIKLDVLRAQQQVRILQDQEKNLLKDSKNLNAITSYYLTLKKQINLFDSVIFFEGKSLEILQLSASENTSRLKLCQKELSSVKISLQEINDEIQAVIYQIEKINEKKMKNKATSSQNSKELEEEKIVSLKQRMEEIEVDLENSLKDLASFESDYQSKLSLIEQEESMLRTQHQALESALRKVEIESKKINEMQIHLGKIDDADAAPNPETLKDQNRSRSALRLKDSMREDFYTSELKDGEEGSCKVKGNSYMELIVKQMGRKVSLITEREGRVPNKKYYRFNLEDITAQEKNFLEKIMPMLEGIELYKKVAAKNQSKSAFEPLDPFRGSPESCGYALRQFRLHKLLNKIDIRQTLKPGIESSINIEYILAPILSPNVLLILKIQNHLNSDELDCEKILEKAKETNYSDINSNVFREKARECIYYPFSLCFMQGEKIELIAKTYQNFKHWINGVNALVKFKKLIPRIKTRIEAYTTV